MSRVTGLALVCSDVRPKKYVFAHQIVIKVNQAN